VSAAGIAFRRALALLLLAGCQSAPAPRPPEPAHSPEPVASSGPATSPEPGPAAVGAADASPEQVIVEACQSCHGRDMLSQQRLTAAQWKRTVEKMRGWGAPVDEAEVEPLARHLATVAGPDAGPDATPSVPAAEAEAALAPQPDGPFADGDVRLGRETYDARCLVCHGDGAHGAKPGPNLIDRPILFRAAEFAERVRKGTGLMRASPDATDDEIAGLLAYLRGETRRQ